MAVPSMAGDRNVGPIHTHAMLTQCYEIPEKLIEYNKRKFGWNDKDAKYTAEAYCGRLLMKAQKNGVGVILLNMYESTRIDI